MQIIVIGCGNVGKTLADQLVKENHDIVIIDKSADRLNNLSEDIDCIKIVGNGGSISVLMEAGIETADLLIAVTDSDELNLLCCLIAKKVNKLQTIARVRDPIYTREIDFVKQELGISMIINPELAGATEIAKVLSFPSALSIGTFSSGKIELVKFKVRPEQKLDGLSVMDVDRKLQGGVLIVGVERGNEVYIPDGRFVLKNGDEVSILSSIENATTFFKKIGMNTKSVKNVILVGAGTTAEYLATLLAEKKINVKLIEKNRSRCEELAELLPKTLVIHGDGTDRALLLEEGLKKTDALVTLTNLDEENMILSLFAKEHTDAKLVTKVDRIDYMDMIRKLDIGTTIYPKYITADYIIQYVRSMKQNSSSNVGTLYHVMNGETEALEFTIRENSKVTSATLQDISLKPNILIGCINRNGKIIIPRGQDRLQVGDTVIVVTTQKGLHDIKDICK